MAFGLTAGGAALLGAGTSLIGNIAGGSMDAENEAQQSQESRELSLWNTEVGRQDDLWAAGLQQEQFGAQTVNQAALAENRLAAQASGDKYAVLEQQARYDAFQEQFGDVKDNVNNYFRTLSASSIKAQNIDDINKRVAGVDQRLTQTMAARGISGASGLSIQALASNMMAGETEKVMANRNVDTEVAQAQSSFLTAQANDPLLARAPDYAEGQLTQDELAGLTPNTVDNGGIQTTYDIPEQQALPMMPEVEEPKATGIGGFLGSIF